MKAFVLHRSARCRRLLIEALSSRGGLLLTGQCGPAADPASFPRLDPDLFFMELSLTPEEAAPWLKALAGTGARILRLRNEAESLAAGMYSEAGESLGLWVERPLEALKQDILQLLEGKPPPQKSELPVSIVAPSAPLPAPVGSVASPPLRSQARAPSPCRSPLTLPRLVLIGVSTGGPEALMQIIPALSAPYPCPILIVQHMPRDFTAQLARSLGRQSALPVAEAEDRAFAEPGHVYLAPGDFHLGVEAEGGRVCLHVRSGPKENSCRPAVDYLFRSAAEAFPDKPLWAVILTGMGQDGLKGVERLKRGNCYCITQSRETCVIYGMPRAVDEAGLSDLSLDLPSIAPFLCGKTP